MFILSLLKSKDTSPIIGEVFDNVFTNTSKCTDFVDYTTRSTASRYTFNYSGTSISIRGKNTFTNASFNHLEIFVDDNHYMSLPISNTDYNNVTFPKGNKKISILTGGTTTTSMLGTYLTGLTLDTTRYTKINTQDNSTEIVFLGDSITVGDSAITPVNGYSWLFYKENKLSTTILGYGYGKLFDFGSDTNKINSIVTRITTSFKSAPTKKLVIALGTNDYGLDTRPAVDFLGYARNLINAIVAADSTIEIFWNEPLRRGGETSLIQDYRDGLVALSTELGTFTVIPCKEAAGYPSGYTGAVHPNTTGHKRYKDFIYPYVMQ